MASEPELSIIDNGIVVCVLKESGGGILSLGAVKVGSTKSYSFQLRNDFVHPMAEIKVRFLSDEVKVIRVPSELEPKEAKEMIIEYIPSVESKRGINCAVTSNGVYLA